MALVAQVGLGPADLSPIFIAVMIVGAAFLTAGLVVTLFLIRQQFKESRIKGLLLAIIVACFLVVVSFCL